MNNKNRINLFIILFINWAITIFINEKLTLYSIISTCLLVLSLLFILIKVESMGYKWTPFNFGKFFSKKNISL